MRKVVVSSYDKYWEDMFRNEKKLIQTIFGSLLVETHHIGSTSVPGLKAKPIIDIMPVVISIEQVALFNEEMILAGYEPKGENGITGRRYYQKGGDNRSHHLHFFEVGDPHIERHLAFRDFLRAHPDMARRYGDLKETLSIQYPYDIESYIKGKEELVIEIEDKAQNWFKTKTKGENHHAND